MERGRGKVKRKGVGKGGGEGGIQGESGGDEGMFEVAFKCQRKGVKIEGVKGYSMSVYRQCQG